MKVVINRCYGEFDLSDKAKEILGIEYETEIERNDPRLVAVVEELGDEANTWCSSLKIVEIPEDVDWVIEDYDGLEWVSEKHRTWS